MSLSVILSFLLDIQYDIAYYQRDVWVCTRKKKKITGRYIDPKKGLCA